MAKRDEQTRQGRSKKAIIPDHTVSEFFGLNTYIKDIKELRDGESPDSLNWITGQFKDHIELRRGYALLGSNRMTGSGRVTGMGVGQLRNGIQVPYYTYGEKINYYNSATNLTTESGSNMLGANANGEDVAIMPYQNITGSYVYFTSPNSSIFKNSPANPATTLDLNSKAFRGLAKIDTNRMFLWQRKDQAGTSYATILYLGVTDASDISSYTQKTAQSQGTGDGSTKTFVITLSRDVVSNNVADTVFSIEIAAPIAAGQSITGITKATQAVISIADTSSFSIGSAIICQTVSGMTNINGIIGIVMQINPNVSLTVSINSSSFSSYTSGGTVYPCEYFSDDQNGNLTSDKGGTGSINYINGSGTVTFMDAPLNSQTIESQYYEENSSSGGITDFTIDGKTTGKGKTFPQFDGGGTLESVWPFDQVQYCFHQLKTWYVNLGSDDTNATNLPYRSNFGIPYWRGAFPTPDGILVLDNSHPVEPKVRFLEISPSVAALISIIPTSISDALDLSQYGFSQVVTRRWGDYDLIGFANITNGVVDNVNTRMLVRNIFSGQWDIVDYPVSCLDEYNGMLISGDSLSNNVFVLFSGTDDDNSLITNYWKDKQYLFAEGMKKFNKFVVKGLIQSSQNLDIYFAFDNGTFVKYFTVQGTGSYVNTGSPNIVGANTLGSQVVGGGAGQGPSIVAYPYEVEFYVGSDQFEYVQPMFEANSIGYVSIDQYTFKDIRWKGKKSSPSRFIIN